MKVGAILALLVGCLGITVVTVAREEEYGRK